MLTRSIYHISNIVKSLIVVYFILYIHHLITNKSYIMAIMYIVALMTSIIVSYLPQIKSIKDDFENFRQPPKSPRLDPIILSTVNDEGHTYMVIYMNDHKGSIAALKQIREWIDNQEKYKISQNNLTVLCDNVLEKVSETMVDKMLWQQFRCK